MNKFEEKKIPIISFYSGGGFMDMGFEMAGFEIVWTNEIDEIFAKLHSAGITSWRKSRGNGIKAEIFNTKSITDVTSTEIISEAFPKGKPNDFGIIGGPPCQDFSLNGNMEGFEGDRGKLTTLFFNKILELKPTFFVMENVTGLVRIQSNKEHLLKLLKKIEKEYFVDYKILNSLEFGVPQSRERIFFIGISKSKLKQDKLPLGTFKFPWPESKYSLPIKIYDWPRLNKFGEKVTKPIKIPMELCVKKCLVSEKKQAIIPNANEYFRLMNAKKLLKIKEGETNRPSFKRLHRYRYSPTACYGNNEVHLHPTENRRISVREALRIQGVPDSYVLPSESSLAKKFKMIGNGVPVPLAKFLSKALLNYLKEMNIINK